MNALFKALAGLALLSLATACSQNAKTTTKTAASAGTPAAGDSTALAKKPDWLKETVVYQLYPRSFQDSNGDGMGNLKGITSRLDYLNIGVGTVWLNLIYASPSDDNGYDISDYQQIMPEFGPITSLMPRCSRACTSAASSWWWIW